MLVVYTIKCSLQDIKLDLSPFSGVALRVKGDGQIYKINIKTEDRGSDPESTYAATFETTGKLLSHQGVMERQSLIFTLTASYSLQEIRCPQILGRTNEHAPPQEFHTSKVKRKQTSSRFFSPS